MENQSPSLGDQIARLRGTAQARENRVWLPDAVHALIAAIFARIFGRLETLLRLWQSGDFPAQPLRPQPAPTAPRHCAPRHHVARAPYLRARRTAPQRANPSQRIRHVPNQAPRTAPPRMIRPCERQPRRLARAPPPTTSAANTPLRGVPGHGYIITITI